MLETGGDAQRGASWVRPHPAITDPVQRRQARLLSTLLLLFMALVAVTILIVPARVASVPYWQDPLFQVGAGVVVAFAAAYALSRSRHVQAGVALFIATTVVAVWVLAALSGGTPWQEGAPTFLLFSVLVASLVTRLWVTAAIAVLNVATVLLVGPLGQTDAGTFAVQVIVLCVFPPLVLASAYLRQEDLRRLEAQRQQFERLVEDAPDAMVIVDARGGIVLANAQAERMFGYDRRELVGQSVEVLVPDGARAKHPAHRADYMRNPKTRPMGAGIDLSARRKDGTEFPVEISLSPLRTTAGMMVSSVIRDVSDRRRMEQLKREAEAKEQELASLRRIDAVKTNLLKTASHELNTPLTPIRLQLHVLKDDAHLTEKQRNALAIVDRNFARLSNLVGDVLDAVRLQSGQLRLRLGPTDLVALVQESIGSYPPGEPTLQVDPATPASLVVPADESRIAQVLGNLIANARKFTPPSGRVTVRVHAAGQQAVVTVTDTGIGFDPAQAARLFEPFGQLHDANAASGTGLGLYISKGIVEAHGGTIGGESQGAGQGASFWFRLPLGGPPPA